jgi:hypothetical protein
VKLLPVLFALALFALLVLGGAAACHWWLEPRASSTLAWTASPTELAPGASFVAARGSSGGASRLAFEARQWQGGPLRAWVTSGGVELVRVGPLAGELSGTCELPDGPFELHVENADTVARIVDVKARLAD